MQISDTIPSPKAPSIASVITTNAIICITMTSNIHGVGGDGGWEVGLCNKNEPVLFDPSLLILHLIFSGPVGST